MFSTIVYGFLHPLSRRSYPVITSSFQELSEEESSLVQESPLEKSIFSSSSAFGLVVSSNSCLGSVKLLRVREAHSVLLNTGKMVWSISELICAYCTYL